MAIWEGMHRQAGLDWSTDLAQAKVLARRSIERGMGPAKRANTVIFEKVAARTDTEEDIDLIIVGAMWMLRGAEIDGLLLEQVWVAEDCSEATIIIGASKTNPEAGVCDRTLRCSCQAGPGGNFFDIGLKSMPRTRSTQGPFALRAFP